jgi:hypothetical protein
VENGENGVKRVTGRRGEVYMDWLRASSPTITTATQGDAEFWQVKVRELRRRAGLDRGMVGRHVPIKLLQRLSNSEKLLLS